jgi:hypothetical protein
MDQPTTKCPKSMLEEFHGNYGVLWILNSMLGY